MKALATTQVVLLVLGIIVLAVIGYLIYSQFIKSTTQMTSTNCQSAVFSVCTSCKTCITSFGGSWTLDADPCPECNDKIPGRACDNLCKPPNECKDTIQLNDYGLVTVNGCLSLGVN